MHADLPHDAPQRLGWLPGWLARGWLSLLAGWLAVAGWLARWLAKGWAGEKQELGS